MKTSDQTTQIHCIDVCLPDTATIEMNKMLLIRYRRPTRPLPPVNLSWRFSILGGCRTQAPAIGVASVNLTRKQWSGLAATAVNTSRAELEICRE